MPKVFMYEDGYNFFAPKSTTVGTSLGTSGCDGAVGTGVLSITFFVALQFQPNPPNQDIFPQFPPKLPST